MGRHPGLDLCPLCRCPLTPAQRGAIPPDPVVVLAVLGAPGRVKVNRDSFDDVTLGWLSRQLNVDFVESTAADSR